MPSLYCAHFQLEETPFSVAPDPCFLYMSEPHREALGHLLYGLGEGGGFVQLTGEVGTGKTTICRTLLCQLPENVDVALIFNSKLTVSDLLQTICEELQIEPAKDDRSTKANIDRLYAHLLDANAKGRRTILIIDEAQNLSGEVLEQVRLLTNLETNDDKLLQIFLIGQPELRNMLERADLRQLAQRITARYHLQPLSRTETEQYIRHRLSVAGCERRLFDAAAMRCIFRLTGGIPRLINSLCDRAMLGAFVTDCACVDARIVRRAHRELRGEPARRPALAMRYAAVGCAVVAALIMGILAANPDATESMLERVSMASITGVDNAASGNVESAAVASLMPAQDVSVASPANAKPVIAPAMDVPAARAQAERSVESVSYRLDTTPSRARAVLRQSGVTNLATLAERLDSAGSGTSLAAERQLFALWEVPETAPEGDLCVRAAEQGLECFAKSGSWDKLRGFDLPALLTLRRDGAEPVQALLTRLVGQDATLYLDGQAHSYRLHQVDRHWTGQFTLLWKPPLEQVTVIHPAHFGRSVQWLHQLFARVDGVEVEAGNAERLQAELAARIKDFQRRRGLFADGIAGPETLIHLSSVMPDSAMPSLSATTASAAARGVTPTVAYLRE